MSWMLIITSYMDNIRYWYIIFHVTAISNQQHSNEQK